MSGEIIIANKNAIVVGSQDFGYYVKRSTLCPVCNRLDHMDINATRARDHMTISEISQQYGLPVITLEKHFDNHFMVSVQNRKIINLKENDDQESRELVTRILEGNVDLIEGAESVLKSKSQRLHMITQRIRALTDKQEIGVLEDIELQELNELHKRASDLEDSIVKTFIVIDKKMFPFKKEEMINAVTSYKLSVLGKMVDAIQLVFVDFEKQGGEYQTMVQEMRVALADKFNKLEDQIVKAGGIIKPVDDNENEIKF